MIRPCVVILRLRDGRGSIRVISRWAPSPTASAMCSVCGRCRAFRSRFVVFDLLFFFVRFRLFFRRWGNGWDHAIRKPFGDAFGRNFLRLADRAEEEHGRVGVAVAAVLVIGDRPAPCFHAV